MNIANFEELKIISPYSTGLKKLAQRKLQKLFKVPIMGTLSIEASLGHLITALIRKLWRRQVQTTEDYVSDDHIKTVFSNSTEIEIDICFDMPDTFQTDAAGLYELVIESNHSRPIIYYDRKFWRKMGVFKSMKKISSVVNEGGFPPFNHDIPRKRRALVKIGENGKLLESLVKLEISATYDLIRQIISNNQSHHTPLMKKPVLFLVIQEEEEGLANSLVEILGNLVQKNRVELPLLFEAAVDGRVFVVSSLMDNFEKLRNRFEKIEDDFSMVQTRLCKL